ncbi:hypothetical protein D3C81_630720 [compost metagenome]
MDIGDYIETNSVELFNWGKAITDELTMKHGALLKVPASMRVKDVVSARKKQLKKGYSNPALEMTDLVGARFVVLTSDEVLPILDTIRASVLWDHKQTRDPGAEAEQHPTVFEYQSHHYELRPKGDSHLCCEVQVRTLLQHTIAELSHDAFYKASVEAPNHAMRLVARSIALMETTDELLCKAMQTVRAAQEPVEALKREAITQSDRLGGGGGELLDDLFEAYGAGIDYATVEEFRAFVRDYGFVLERIAARRDNGVFSFSASALMTYWFAKKIGKKMFSTWPYPGSVSDLRLIFSDLGLAT